MERGHKNNKKPDRQSSIGLLWSHQGLNLGPPDYESGATNQLSYRTIILFAFGDFCVGLRIVGRSLPKGNSLPPHLPALKSLKTNSKWDLQWFQQTTYICCGSEWFPNHKANIMFFSISSIS